MTTDVADQMSAFLAALWQGGGPTLSTFPSSRRGMGSLDETELTYLLESEAITDAAFWNRVVKMISLPVLLRTPTTDTGNLQHLMRQAIQLWNSRVCMIVPGMADATTSPWRWAVKAGQLILQTPRFQIQVAQSRRQLPHGASPASTICNPWPQAPEHGYGLGREAVRSRPAARRPDVQMRCTSVCTMPDGIRADALHDGVADTRAVRAWTRTAPRSGSP